MKKQSKRRAAPKKLRAIQTSRHLHVSPHKHTGHILPRQHTSYPVLLMIVLCVGVLLSGWTRFVQAAFPGPVSDTYTVHASVPGVAPEAAHIDEPVEGTRTGTRPITVKGTCPTNSYLELIHNGVFAGTVVCQSNGSFELNSILFRGNNSFVVNTFNFANVAGPASNTVHIYYDPSIVGTIVPTVKTSPANTPPSSATSGVTISETNPLLLSTTYRFQGFYVGDPVGFSIGIDGGGAPYAISIDWGDGVTDLLSQPTSGLMQLKHVYHKHGGYRGNYTISVTAKDARGNSTELQVVAIVNDKPQAGGITAKAPSDTGTSSSASDQLGRIFKYVWPSYGVVVLMLTSFWLGERREFKYLRPRLKRTYHHR